MATITLEYDNRSKQAKKLIEYVRSLQFVKITTEKAEPEFDLYKSLDSAFADVRLMRDGKKKKKTAQEFLEEIRNGK